MSSDGGEPAAEPLGSVRGGADAGGRCGESGGRLANIMA